MKAMDQVYSLMSQAREKIMKVSKNLNADQIQKDLEKLRKKLQQQGQQRINEARSTTLARLAKLQKEYNFVFTKLEKAQTQAKKDVNLVRKNLHKQMVELEKQMNSLRKNLEGKRDQFEKMVMGKTRQVKKSVKKASVRKTSSKKATRKTMKK